LLIILSVLSQKKKFLLPLNFALYGTLPRSVIKITIMMFVNDWIQLFQKDFNKWKLVSIFFLTVSAYEEIIPGVKFWISLYLAF